MLKFSSRATQIQIQMTSLTSTSPMPETPSKKAAAALAALTFTPEPLVEVEESEEEPLLKESRRRFVLFPIQYHEVRVVSCTLSFFPLLTTIYSDLADVQEGRSLLLDRGRD